jgi:TPR repeat protein
MHDDEQARLYYELAAKKGQIGAWLILDNLYKNGKGVEQDYNKARRTLLRTGWQQTKAMPLHKNDLGVLYYEGKGVQQDCNKARHVCELAANQGNAKARYNIGVL